MALEWLLADYRRPGTYRIYDYRLPTAEEMLYGTHEATGGYDVEWDPDLRRPQYRPTIAMAWIDPRPDQPRGATFFVRYLHETSIEEAVTPDDVAQRSGSLLRCGTTSGYDFWPHPPRTVTRRRGVDGSVRSIASCASGLLVRGIRTSTDAMRSRA